MYDESARPLTAAIGSAPNDAAADSRDDGYEEVSALLRSAGLHYEGAQLRPMHSGRSGARTYAVSSGEHQVVARMFGKERFAGQHQQHVRLQALAAHHGLAPQVLAVASCGRGMLMECVQGQPFLLELQHPGRHFQVLEALGQRLGALHSVPVPSDAVVQTPLAQVRALVAQRELPRFAQAAQVALDAMQVPSDDRVLCHQDLNPTNLLCARGTLYFLDWETASPGDGYFDLATLINGLLLGPPSVARLLQGYREQRKLAQLDESRLRAARALAHLAYGFTFLDLVPELTTQPRSQPRPDFAADQLPTLLGCYQALQSGALVGDTEAAYWQLAAAHLRAFYEMGGA